MSLMDCLPEIIFVLVLGAVAIFLASRQARRQQEPHTRPLPRVCLLTDAERASLDCLRDREAIKREAALVRGEESEEER
jgi:hypothetical protein